MIHWSWYALQVRTSNPYVKLRLKGEWIYATIELHNVNSHLRFKPDPLGDKKIISQITMSAIRKDLIYLANHEQMTSVESLEFELIFVSSSLWWYFW